MYSGIRSLPIGSNQLVGTITRSKIDHPWVSRRSLVKVDTGLQLILGYLVLGPSLTLPLLLHVLTKDNRSLSRCSLFLTRTMESKLAKARGIGSKQ